MLYHRVVKYKIIYQPEVICEAVKYMKILFDWGSAPDPTVYQQQLIRPPGTAVQDGLMFYRRCIFFFFLFRHSFSELPRPIALKLCYMVDIWLNFITPLQKLGGAPQKKLGGQKHAKFRSILDHFRL